MKAIAVGTVELPVKVWPQRSGSKTHSTIRIENVLHVPDALCNILSAMTADWNMEYRVMHDGTVGTLSDDNGRRLGCLVNRCGVTVLKLS